MKAETIKLYWNRPDFDDHVGSSMLSCSLLLAAYECGNTSAAAVYDVSLTTVDIKSLLPCTVCPRYNAPRYNADSGITRSTVAPENEPARGRFFIYFFSPVSPKFSIHCSVCTHYSCVLLNRLTINKNTTNITNTL